ncbi:hypothetical protein BELL_1450g00020 [Botrytis elliptica]|uniref:Uncharacterized protein n=1 Tax=Botrytis elliptica TaxID=278938 RepID=A0A4Z1I2L6_9HELO|nr:hypothetical protein BELL_1450g00020 [Botrytis elliptica]
MIYDENISGLGGMKLLIKATRNAAASSNLDYQLPVLKHRNKRNPTTKKCTELRRRRKLASGMVKTNVGIPLNWTSYSTILQKSFFSSKRSKKYFHLQTQISILLFAYSQKNRGLCTYRPVEASEASPKFLPGPDIHNLDEILDFGGVFNEVEDSGISTANLDVLEEVLVSTILFLHTKRISYPISDIDKLYFVYSDSLFEGNEKRATLRLLLGPNKSASLISNTNDSSTTLSNDIKQARSIFYFPKIKIFYLRISNDNLTNIVLTQYFAKERLRIK